MKRRDFIPLLGGAFMLLADVMLGNVGVARSEGVVERLSVPEFDRVQRRNLSAVLELAPETSLLQTGIPALGSDERTFPEDDFD